MAVWEEIENQLFILPNILEQFDKMNLTDMIRTLRSSNEIIYVGCGSSYYIGITASKYTKGVMRKKSQAIPGGEVMFAFDWNIVNSDKTCAVLISRSGETTEVIESAKILKNRGVKTIGITLERGSLLSKNVDTKVILPFTEKSIVMTSSFSGILLILQLIIERAADMDKKRIYENLMKELNTFFENARKTAESFSNGKHYVFLGTGPYEGIARESALKLQEMSLTMVEAYSTLDYRHGPKSLVEDGTVVVLFGDDEYSKKLAEEIESIGGKAIVRNRLTENYEDSFIQVIFSQLLGYEIAMRKNIDVESPRNLTKVVKLDE